VLIFSFSQFVLGLSKVNAGIVKLVLELCLTLVVVIEFFVHAVLQFTLAAVILFQPVFQRLDLFAGFLQFGLSLVGFTLEVVDVRFLLGEDLALVTLELVEVTEDKFIVSLSFLLIFGYLCLAFETFFIFGSEFVEFVLEVIQLPF